MQPNFSRIVLARLPLAEAYIPHDSHRLFRQLPRDQSSRQSVGGSLDAQQVQHLRGRLGQLVVERP
jgi:hypothetical protein